MPNPIFLNIRLPKAMARWIDTFATREGHLIGQDRKRPNRSEAIRRILEDRRAAEGQREPAS